ncbi:PD40 domain-containing protein [Glaciecola sp. XM2]|jgi:Tol biopolymer transport system component/imidazolonepropionase-like amidohydrolase|uniref:amidohydrolase family protein n=1 Tax=Glaciecola sp. XM2 TaxID=1914931 RepID=UPI001BDF67BE|nr:amidohydrolase family protein [Glaciecola sp. XM2]MBT1450295.1 PD40 domain-containing protein [Glaciecola sp. XM2]
MRSCTFALPALFFTLLALPTLAVSNDDAHLASDSEAISETWDVLNPPLKLQTLTINTNETTWSSLDIMPNGKQFVFDMLGDIFIVDINGGEATSLTQDFAWNIHPTVSPDGSKIAFISDRDGLSNVWIMDINGDNLRQLTHEKKNLIHSPKWSPDGEFIVVSKGFVSSRSIPAGEIWLYHHSGGSGIAIKTRENGLVEQQNIADPAFSPDGQFIYYTHDITPGSGFDYNRDPLKNIFAITRYDRKTGEEERFITGSGGSVVPTPSPDGKYVAFIRRIKNKTALFLKDLSTGLEKPLFLELERDMQEGFGSEGYFAYFDWMPDSQSIIFWTAGKFHRLNIKDKSLNTLDLSVSTTVQYADALRFKVDVAPDEFDVKAIRWAQKSPDGKSVLFQALGKLYLKDIKSGDVKRLTRQNEHDEYYPRYSNDGKQIVYTTWDDQELGAIRVISARGGKGKVVSLAPGHYIEPSFSIGGDKIAYRKFTGGYLLDPKYSTEPGLYVLDLDQQSATRISKSGIEPHFSAGDERVYFTESVSAAYPETQFVSVDLNGEDKQVHLYGADQVSEYRLSPDKKHVAFVYQYNTFVMPFTQIGKTITVGPNMTSLPVKQLSARAGNYMTWRDNSSTVGWSHGPRFFERSLTDAFDFLNAENTTLPEPVTEGINLTFKQTFDKPEQVLALQGGTVITMRDANNIQEVIEDGVVIIEGNRVKAVGTRSQVSIPEGARIVDTTGKSIIPGLIDAHAHGSQGSNEIIPQQSWEQISNLAFGVTTIHDPSNDTSEILAAAELQRAGRLLAPRIYSTGTILYGAEALNFKAIIDDYDDAYYHVQRLKDYGAISVKSYNQPRRDQRQQVLVAADKLNMMVMPEGGGKLQQNMSMIVDGHTGLEHNIPIARGYDDLTQLWQATEFGYTPTFVVSFGGLMGEEYYYDRTEVWKNERLLRYVPQFMIDARAIRRPTAPDNQYNHIEVAKYAKHLRDRGVRVMIGAHGQREGLGAHWEMWIMQQGGFTPWEAIRGGTIDGATHLGMDADIGSIEVGKLADIAIIDGDVLSDLKRSEYVSHVVINGRIFDTTTMNELGSKTQRQPFFFEGNNQLFMPEETRIQMENKAQHYHWVH